MRKEYKLPTIVGLVVLIAGIAAGVFLVQRGQIFKLRASPEETPQQVRFTNITDSSVTVSWLTEKETVGFVSYGKSASLGQTESDELSREAGSRTHHTTLKGLSPATTYFLKVGSGKSLFGNNGEPYEVTTAPKKAAPARSDIIFGTVKQKGGLPSEGAIVYATITGISPLSSVTDASGKWNINLAAARTTTLSSYASYRPEDKMQIFVQAGTEGFASAIILVGAARPVPPITLGENLDFTNLEPTEASELPSSEVTLPREKPATPSSGFKIDDQQTTGQPSSVSLESPDSEEKINSAKPQFIGTGTPGTTFTITVESQPLTDKVTVDSNGSWGWTPPTGLEPGDHTVTIAWKDEAGQTRTLKRSFTVLAAGASDLPSFTASPSGSPASLSPTPSPSPSPSPSPAATSSTRTTVPSTEGGVPVPGSLTATFGFLIMGLVLLLAGALLPKALKY